MSGEQPSHLTIMQAARLVDGVTRMAVKSRIASKRLSSCVYLGVEMVPRIEVERWQQERSARKKKKRSPRTHLQPDDDEKKTAR